MNLTKQTQNPPSESWLVFFYVIKSNVYLAHTAPSLCPQEVLRGRSAHGRHRGRRHHDDADADERRRHRHGGGDVADVTGPDPGAHCRHAGGGAVAAEEPEGAREGPAARLHHDQQLLPAPRRLRRPPRRAGRHGSARRRHRQLLLRQQEEPGTGQSMKHNYTCWIEETNP